MDELQKIKKKETITVENLWQVIESHQGETFLTVKHRPFTYTIKGGELFTDRKRKSITRSTFEKAYIRVQEEPESITGPKTLYVFGAPYIWALFLAFGVVEEKVQLTEEIPGILCRSRGFLRVNCPLLS